MAYKNKLSRLLARLLLKSPGSNEMTSVLLRKLFYDGYNIEVGLYSYGCFDRERFNPNMKVGRYCSFSQSCRRVNANHPTYSLSMSPYLYNPKFGIVDRETVDRSFCTIEDDVWVGHNVIILPSVTKIGRGAVIAAGTVVTKNVAPYDIIAGSPGKVIKKRFSNETIAKIEKSEWWKLDVEHLEYLFSDKPSWINDPNELPNCKIIDYLDRK